MNSTPAGSRWADLYERIRRIPPTALAARDEGPQLISLDEPSDEKGFGKSVNYYTTLADKLLQMEGKNKRQKTQSTELPR